MSREGRPLAGDLASYSTTLVLGRFGPGDRKWSTCQFHPPFQSASESLRESSEPRKRQDLTSSQTGSLSTVDPHGRQNAEWLTRNRSRLKAADHPCTVRGDGNPHVPGQELLVLVIIEADIRERFVWDSVRVIDRVSPNDIEESSVRQQPEQDRTFGIPAIETGRGPVECLFVNSERTRFGLGFAPTEIEHRLLETMQDGHGSSVDPKP